ncbi:hypothetical protein NMY22_g6509 [Coprinellus aureogranulatus]|nr:hypothetical protein NMY22_g6509 [Coprinellus aureogranulatus]
MNIDTAWKISRTNDVVGPETVPELTVLGRQRQEDVLGLEKTERTLMVLLAAARRQIVQAKRDVEICSSLATPRPISRLAPELLSNIFAFAATGDDGLDLCRTQQCPLPICLVLVRVCKHWREVALQTSAIWANHSVMISKRKLAKNREPTDKADPAIDMHHFRDVLALYGRNLRRLSIHLRLRGTAVEWEAIRRGFIPSYKDQLVFLCIIGRPHFEGITEISMPLLEELHLATRTIYHESTKAIHFDTPKLHTLYVCGQLLQPVSAFPQTLRFQQIKRLWLGALCRGGGQSYRCEAHAYHFFSHLTQFSSITDLHLAQLELVAEGVGVGALANMHQQYVRQEVITLGQLKTLEIINPYTTFLGVGLFDHPLTNANNRDSDGKMTYPFLPRISAPSLETLDCILSQDCFYSELEKAFKPFLKRTPTLRRIRFVLFDKSSYLAIREPYKFESSFVLYLAGDGEYFSNLNELSMPDGDRCHFFEYATKRSSPPTGWLGQGELIGRLVDRYFGQLPIVEEPESAGSIKLSPKMRKSIQAIFKMFGSEGALGRNVVRELYIAS